MLGHFYFSNERKLHFVKKVWSGLYQVLKASKPFSGLWKTENGP
jgi:hypothetical protein